MGRISPGPTRWPPWADRLLKPAKSNLQPQIYLAEQDLAGKFAALISGVSPWQDYLPQHVISGNKLRCAGTVLVPAALVLRVIAAVHNSVHGGTEKTYQLV